MILKSFSYKDLEHSVHKFMELDTIPFNHINLIVGRNSVGKSSIVKNLIYYSKMIKQEVPIIVRGEFHSTFLTEEEEELNYYSAHFWNEDKSKDWLEEKLTFQEKSILERNNGEAKIRSNNNSHPSEINPPSDKLVIQVRRDEKEYPLIEKIISWAESTYFFEFGTLSPHKINFKSEKSDFLNMIPRDVENMDSTDMKLLIQDMKLLGYEIEKISVMFPNNVHRAIIDVWEKGVPLQLPHFQLSQGMLRTLFLVIFINSRIKEGKISTLVIDDLCEGLDYNRATKLGKLLLEKIKENDIQLIATSNDSFLMDVFPIRYWNILNRKNNVINSVNYENNKEKFDDYKFTGLNNFHLFSSDYLL